MVILTIGAPSNYYTIRFERPIEKPTYIRLLSCSLYDSWQNLKVPGSVTLIDPQAKEPKSAKLTAGITLLIFWKKNLATLKVQVTVKKNESVEALVIYNLNVQDVWIDSDLQIFFEKTGKSNKTWNQDIHNTLELSRELFHPLRCDVKNRKSRERETFHSSGKVFGTGEHL